ncbi:MAG: hypothetical protein ACT4O1_07190 [Gemmatimonadota bacterium]
MLVEAVEPPRPSHAGFADALDVPEAAFGPLPVRPQFQNSEGWDFYPWMFEKVTRIKSGAQRLIEHWSTDARAIHLKPDAPMSPRDWIREGIGGAISEIEINAAKVFEALFDDEVTVEDRSEHATPVRRHGEPWSIPFLIEPDDTSIELVKIGLPSGPWTTAVEDWRLGAFSETLPHVESALLGQRPPIRILNVQVWHGADVIVTASNVQALLWRKWKPVHWDTGDRGIRQPEAGRVELSVAAWAATRPNLKLLTDMGSLTIAVIKRIAFPAVSLADLAGTPVSSVAELDAEAVIERMAYEAELEQLLPREQR